MKTLLGTVTLALMSFAPQFSWAQSLLCTNSDWEDSVATIKGNLNPDGTLEDFIFSVNNEIYFQSSQKMIPTSVPGLNSAFLFKGITNSDHSFEANGVLDASHFLNDKEIRLKLEIAPENNASELTLQCETFNSVL